MRYVTLYQAIFHYIVTGQYKHVVSAKKRNVKVTSLLSTMEADFCTNQHYVITEMTRDMLEIESHFSELFTVSSKRRVYSMDTIHDIKSNQFIEYAMSCNLYYRQPCKMSGFYP